MSADNWRELLREPFIEELVQQAARTEGRRLYWSPRDALLLDDLESWLWDRSVNVAEHAPDHMQPGSRHWHAYLYGALRISARERHRREVAGRPSSSRGDGWAKTSSLQALETAVGFHPISRDDPLAILLRCERLQAAITKAQNLAGADGTYTTSITTCTEPMCSRPVNARGLCTTHYERARGRGEFGTATCTAPDCDRQLYARGLCRRHYVRAKRRGDL